MHGGGRNRLEIHPVFSSLMMAVSLGVPSVRELCCREGFEFARRDIVKACVCGSGPEMTREIGVSPEGCADEGSCLGRHPMKRNMLCVSRPDSLVGTRPNRQRHDVEGIDEVDMEASSGGAWKLWHKSLSDEDKSLAAVRRFAPCLCGTERGMHKVRNSQVTRGYRASRLRFPETPCRRDLGMAPRVRKTCELCCLM